MPAGVDQLAVAVEDEVPIDFDPHQRALFTDPAAVSGEILVPFRTYAQCSAPGGASWIAIVDRREYAGDFHTARAHLAPTHKKLQREAIRPDSLRQDRSRKVDRETGYQNAILFSPSEQFEELFPRNRRFSPMPLAPTQTFNARKVATSNEVVEKVIIFYDVPQAAIIADASQWRPAILGGSRDAHAG